MGVRTNKFKRVLLLALCLGSFNIGFAQTLSSSAENMRGKSFRNITLEASLKPFKKNDKAYIKSVAKEIFTQWYALCRHADTISIMLWTSDGSELLDYSGKLTQPLEWAKYMGNPNTEHAVNSGPVSLTLHERAYEYMDNPPKFTYADLKFIVATLKQVGKEMTGKPIRVGTTFDPGPEFAKSEFKYKKHPEILGGKAMGEKSFVFSYAVLKGDQASYAGYPKGIPEGTPFGTFFGRQSQHFMADLNFDFLWLSNGFGFGMEPWAATGTIFTGKGFDVDKLDDTRKKITDFWTLFRKECPTFRLETRGTNLGTGIDLAKDGVDLNAIYKGGFNILPPPNSPWAALDGDFGLEMIGYMSRIVEVPNDQYLFRYYTHDPWWLNSPWLDRYGREPHDIYLPMAVSMINAGGEICLPSHLAFLTIDNSLGGMPKQVPDEVMPHILYARYNSPTAPGPFVWVYPFDEYHEWARNQKNRLSEMYYGDWFIRQAINNGFPLNTVVSTGSFVSSIKNKPNLYQHSVLVSIVPEAGTAYEQQLMTFVKGGGKLIIYGPADYASKEFKALLNLSNTTALDGEFKIVGNYGSDLLEYKGTTTIRHQALFSGGGIATQVANLADNTHVLVKMEQKGTSRDVVWQKADPKWKGGKIVYVRGTNSSHFSGDRLLTPDDPSTYFVGPLYLRYVMKEFGYELALSKKDVQVKNPVVTIAKANNAFFLAGYAPNTTVKHAFKFPQGMPILGGYDTEIVDGKTTYNFATSWNRECRVFIEQESGIVSAKEIVSREKGKTRRIRINGLKNATVRIYPDENITADQMKFYMAQSPTNMGYPWLGGDISFEKGEAIYGHNFKVKGITGDLIVAW